MMRIEQIFIFKIIKLLEYRNKCSKFFHIFVFLKKTFNILLLK